MVRHVRVLVLVSHAPQLSALKHMLSLQCHHNYLPTGHAAVVVQADHIAVHGRVGADGDGDCPVESEACERHIV